MMGTHGSEWSCKYGYHVNCIWLRDHCEWTSFNIHSLTCSDDMIYTIKARQKWQRLSEHFLLRSSHLWFIFGLANGAHLTLYRWSLMRWRGIDAGHCGAWPHRCECYSYDEMGDTFHTYRGVRWLHNMWKGAGNRLREEQVIRMITNHI